MKKLHVSFWAIFAVSASVSFAEIVIDDFSEADNAHTSQGQAAWADPGIDVMGGIRDGSVGCEDSESDGTTTANITKDGEFEVTTNKKASPSIYLSYDGLAGWGTDKDFDPFNGIISPVWDLTENGANSGFAIVFTHAADGDDIHPFFNDFLLTVKTEGNATLNQCNVGSKGTDVANDWMSENYTTLNGGTSVTFYVPFSALSGTPDMSKVEGFALHICSENRNLEYTLDSISAAVPEPASILMIGFGGVLILFFRRRFT